ncbi:MucBP domain-containing protein [Streptococcus merionis]|uniref:MucBP domain-containing protein n=1 Tax=Streptococcus merionis TaxID=400065 RepID=UPI0035190342
MKTLTKLGVAFGGIFILGVPHVVLADTVEVNYLAKDLYHDELPEHERWSHIANRIIKDHPEGESYKVEILEIPGYSFDKVLVHTNKRAMVPWIPTGNPLTFPYMLEASGDDIRDTEVNVIYKKIENPQTPPAPNDGDSNSDNTQNPPKAKNGGKGGTGFEFENNSDQSESTLQLEARKAEIRAIIENYRALVGQVKALNPADYTPESWNKVYEEDTDFIYINAKSVAKAYEDDLSFITVDPNSLNKYTTLEDLERAYMWGYSFVKNAIPVLQQAVAGLVRVGETPNPQPNPNLQPPAVDKPLILRIVAVADEGVILDEYTITLNPGESKTVTAKEIPGYEVVGDKTRNLDYETIAGRDVGNYIGFMYRKVEEPNPSPNPDGNGENNGSKPDSNGDSQNPDGKNPDEQKPDDNSNQKPGDPDNGKKPDGENPGDGKKPDGDSNGKKPDGNSNGKDQTPPNNGGSNSGGNQTPPSKGNGSGSNGNTQTPPSTNGNGSQIPPKNNDGAGANGNVQNGNTASSGTGGSVKATPEQSAGTGKTEAKSAANTAGGERLPNTSSTGSLLSALGGILAGASLLSFRRKKEN